MGDDESSIHLEASFSRSKKKTGDAPISRSRKKTGAPTPRRRKQTSAPTLRIDDDFVEHQDECSAYDEWFDFPRDDSMVAYQEAGSLPTYCVPCIPRNTTEEAPQVISTSLDEVREPPIEPIPGSTESIEDQEESGWEQDFEQDIILELESSDSWSQVDGGDEIADDSLQSTSHRTTWEILSDVSSVATFNSKTGMSFLDVARSKPLSNRNNNGVTITGGWEEVSKVPKPMSQSLAISKHPDRRKLELTEEEFESADGLHERFDSNFILDGVKCSRGGKKRFMFNHQPRRKYKRWERRRSKRALFRNWY